MSSLLSVVTMAPILMGLPATSGQHAVILLPPLTPRHSGGVVGLSTVLQQQPASQMPLQAYASYAMGPPQVGFPFQSWSSQHFVFLYVWVSNLVYAFCFQVPCWMLYSPVGLNHWVCTIATLWSLPMAGIYATWQCSLAHTRYAQSGSSLHCFE